MKSLIYTLALLVTINFSAQAQSQSSEGDAAPQARESEVLRLEETIRANREQPQVLTIVPWQLPSHQRIDENEAWQPVVDKLPNIERNQFLRELAVVGEILSQTALSNTDNTENDAASAIEPAQSKP